MIVIPKILQEIMMIFSCKNMIKALKAKPINVDTTKYTNFIMSESKKPKALNMIPTSAYDKTNVSDFIPISTIGDKPKSVKLN